MSKYPNLEALLEGRCGPTSQWPGIPAELRCLLNREKLLESRVDELLTARAKEVENLVRYAIGELRNVLADDREARWRNR